MVWVHNTDSTNAECLTTKLFQCSVYYEMIVEFRVLKSHLWTAKFEFKGVFNFYEKWKLYYRSKYEKGPWNDK